MHRIMFIAMIVLQQNKEKVCCKMKVICFGDSNTFGYNPYARCGEFYKHRWTDLLAEKTGWNVVNEGVNGREIPDEMFHMTSDTDLLLIMLGTNDLLQLDTPAAAAKRMELFLSGCSPDKVVLIAPPQMIWGDWVQDEELILDSVRLADLYMELAYRLGIRFLNAENWHVPLAYDGVHFTEEGQQVFADALYNALMRGE